MHPGQEPGQVGHLVAGPKTVELLETLVPGELPAGKVPVPGAEPGRTVCQAELVLMAPKPESYTELARAKVLDGKCWTTPVVTNGLVFIRSTKEAACVDLRAK